MRNASLQQTIDEKQAFEKELLKKVKVKSYWADNGHFADIGIKQEVEKSNKVIAFCGIGARGQNIMVERNVGKITTRSRII